MACAPDKSTQGLRHRIYPLGRSARNAPSCGTMSFITATSFEMVQKAVRRAFAHAALAVWYAESERLMLFIRFRARASSWDWTRRYKQRSRVSPDLEYAVSCEGRGGLPSSRGEPLFGWRVQKEQQYSFAPPVLELNYVWKAEASAKNSELSGPAGGWGSAKSVGEILLREHMPFDGSSLLAHQNKPNGYMCVSCAWAKPAKTHPLEFCENGAKATAWEVTHRRADRAFFEGHALTELEAWSDHDLEEQGRLTHPMRWDAATDKYVSVSWQAAAFEEIAREFRTLSPKEVEFYTSGRASLETAYMYQLFARMYGSNNLPDCSNMCHESSSVGLPESIGASVGTAVLSDFQNCDCIFYIAQNVGTSSPRLLHDLQDAVERGVKVVAINPLHERGLERFINPQAPSQMLTGKETKIASSYYQVKNGGDIAALFEISKALIEADDLLKSYGISRVAGDDAKAKDPSDAATVAFAASIAAAEKKHVLDHDFIKEHTAGFEEFAAAARNHSWDDLERVSGLTRNQMVEAAKTYAHSDAVMMVYGMGLTQHVMGVQNVHMVANLALLRGNIGKPGANICAVRGHSNVQGQRTVGITEKPGLVPLDKLAELYEFEPPRWTGHTTIDACKAILAGEIKAFISLGGNFIRAIPETEAMEAAWRKLRLTVNIATKLNRSHIITAKSLISCHAWGGLRLTSRPADHRRYRWRVPSPTSTALADVQSPLARNCFRSRLSSRASRGQRCKVRVRLLGRNG